MIGSRIKKVALLLAALAAFTFIVRVAALVLCGFVGFSLHRVIHLVDDTREEAWLCFSFVFDWF